MQRGARRVLARDAPWVGQFPRRYAVGTAIRSQRARWHGLYHVALYYHAGLYVCRPNRPRQNGDIGRLTARRYRRIWAPKKIPAACTAVNIREDIISPLKPAYPLCPILGKVGLHADLSPL